MNKRNETGVFHVRQGGCKIFKSENEFDKEDGICVNTDVRKVE